MAVTNSEPACVTPVGRFTTVAAAVTLALPLKLGDVHVTSPVKASVRPLVRVAALPVVDWFRVGNVQFVSVPPDGVPSAPPENSNVLLASGRVKTLVLVVGPVN